MGTAGLTIMGSGLNNRDVRAQDWNGFVNDDWRLSDKFTLTLGFRYDYFGPFTEAPGRFVGFDPTRITTPEISAADGGGFACEIGGVVPTSEINLLIAPRFAFADLAIECDCRIASSA